MKKQIGRAFKIRIRDVGDDEIRSEIISKFNEELLSAKGKGGSDFVVIPDEVPPLLVQDSHIIELIRKKGKVPGVIPIEQITLVVVPSGGLIRGVNEKTVLEITPYMQ